jgi:hypothetical protein
MPAQAGDLCRQQARLFIGTGPFDLPTAKLALQPLINIGRLLTRDGHGDTAYQHFQALFQAAQAQTEITINDLTIRFRDLTASASDHRELTQWLWSILLSDGSRALVAAGRWTDAAARARQHQGIGQRLLDGRQALVLAYCEVADYAAARSTLECSETPTPWEQAVAACLDAKCLTWAGDRASAAAVAHATDRYLALEPARHPAVFHVRLGLSVIDTALASHSEAAVTEIGQFVLRRTLEARDAYAVHDVMSHPAAQASAAPTVRHALEDIIQASALRQGNLAPAALEELMTSVGESEAAITNMLTRRGRDWT